jgi:hypothetical protein
MTTEHGLVSIAAGFWGRLAAVEHVMVPVPEELVPNVLSFLSWKGSSRSASASESRAEAARLVSERADANGEDSGPIARAFALLDDASCALVAAIAAAALERERLSIPEAARRAGVTTREAIGILFEVNNVLTAEGAPAIAFNNLGGRTAGDFTWDSHVIMMIQPLARPLAALARSRMTD